MFQSVVADKQLSSERKLPKDLNNPSINDHEMIVILLLFHSWASK